MINTNDLWGKQKLIISKQLYYEMWEMGITPPSHFPPLVKLGNNILKKKIFKKKLR